MPLFPLVIVTAPGPGSGKMAVCLSQLYQENKKGVKAGYAKFETFPVWNLPLKHPVNMAYEAATADLNDVNMIDPFHLEAYGSIAALRRMPFFFRAYRRCRRFLHVMSGVAAVVNAVAVPLMMTLVLSDLFMKVPMAGALCQLFWLIPTVITALVVSRLNPNKPIA